jgi:hypothetical protein
MHPAFAQYAATKPARDPPETHRPHAPLVPGGPEIRPGWGTAFSYKVSMMNPIEQAVQDVNPKALQSLLASGADPHARDIMTAWTPLHYAALPPSVRMPTGKTAKDLVVSEFRAGSLLKHSAVIP